MAGVRTIGWTAVLAALLGVTGHAAAPAKVAGAPLPPDGVARAVRSVVLVQGELSPGRYQSGSGVVVAPGTIATNAHVVKDAARIRVLKDDQVWLAEAQCLAADQDLVLLRLPGLPLPVAEAAPADQVREGIRVVAFGYPGGQRMMREDGRIEALWAYRGGHLIQTDTHCQPGSSGGGVFTVDGRLLGITTFAMAHGGALDFAIPVDWVVALAQGRQPGARLQCPLIVAGRMLKDFSDLMTEDPDNRSQWEALTRRWTQAAPGDPKAWFALGTSLDLTMREGLGSDASEAIAAYRRALALDPSFAKAWNNLGVDLDLVNATPEAQAAFAEAVRLRPDYALAWLNLGGSRLGSGDLRGARQALSAGLALAGDTSAAWARLAYVETRLGDLGMGIRHYRLALAYAPFHPDWWGELYLACRRDQRAEEADQVLQRLRAQAPDLAQDLERQAPPRR